MILTEKEEEAKVIAAAGQRDLNVVLYLDEIDEYVSGILDDLLNSIILTSVPINLITLLINNINQITNYFYIG